MKQTHQKKMLHSLGAMKKINFLNKYPPGKVNYLFEIITAIILSLSTVASAWSVYQSSSWYKVEKDLKAESFQFLSESIRNSSSAMQLKAIDVNMFLDFAQAYSQNNTDLSDFIFQRFRPEMRTAVDAWIALEPLINPQAPASPFYMDEYILPEEILAEAYLTKVEDNNEEADLAAEFSDTYSKLTVLFASTLFFAGITTKFESARIRLILLLFAFITFLSGLVVIITSPIKF